MTALTFILRERAGRCELHPDTGLAHKAAEAAVSRLNFKDDGWRYCVFTGLFLDVEEARRYAQLRSKGQGCEAAFKLIRDSRKS
jgi:hypothetical protein